MLQAAKFDELRRRGPEMVAVEERREGLDAGERQRCDRRVRARLVEERDRVALAAGAEHAMLGRLDPPARPAFEDLAEIDRERELARRHVEPVAVARPRLQPLDT